MYRFHIYHAYHSSQGWISIFFGVVGIVAGILTFGKVDTFYSVAYIVLGVLFLLYLPLIFRLKAKTTLAASPVLCHPLHYTLSERGVTVRTDYLPAESAESANATDADKAETTEEETTDDNANPADSPEATNPSEATMSWDMVYKAVTTKQSLLIFSSRVNAYIIPKRFVAGQEEAVGKMLGDNLESHRLSYKW